MGFILLNWFAEQIAIRDRALLLKLASAAEADADHAVGDEAKEQVLRAVAECLRARYGEDVETVLSRPECPFNYCSYPDACKERCQHRSQR
jgi:hypothetical protein